VKFRLIVLALIVAVAGAGFLFWARQTNHPISTLPAASEVESMTAQRLAYVSDLLPAPAPPNGPKDGHLPDLDVPREHIGRILETLQPATPIDFEREGYVPWIGLCDLMLHCKSGRSLRVSIYLTPENQPGTFGVFGVDPGDQTWGKYRGGDSRKTWAELLAAYADSRSGKADKPDHGP
jgi:hypothetical protein